jgi:hypothetical protein
VKSGWNLPRPEHRSPERIGDTVALERIGDAIFDNRASNEGLTFD